MEITYNKAKTIKIISDESGREYYEHKCPVCGKFNAADEIVWINKITGKASTGDNSAPYCVDCAPEEDLDEEDYDMDEFEE